jgi:hypothetical protein
MVLYIYKNWFKMLKRCKFPPLIKACASRLFSPRNILAYNDITIYVKSREIHILSTIQILGLMEVARCWHSIDIAGHCLVNCIRPLTLILHQFSDMLKHICIFRFVSSSCKIKEYCPFKNKRD